MVLIQKNLLLRIADYLENPEIKIEQSFHEEYALCFYTVYLVFRRIRDEVALRRILGFTFKKSDVEEIVHKKQMKLEDIFADYIGEEIVLKDATRSKVEEAALHYRRLLNSFGHFEESSF